MAPISQPFRFEAQKYFFQSDSDWFLQKRYYHERYYHEVSLHRKDNNIIVFNKEFSLNAKILKVSKRYFLNTISNYLVAPLGFFYHGFFLGKKVCPIVIANLLVPFEKLGLKAADQKERENIGIRRAKEKEIFRHLSSFFADSGNLCSTLATSYLLFTPLLKTVLVAFQETKNHQRSPLSLCKTFAPLIACLALATINLKRVYTDSQELVSMPYWLRVKILGLDLNQAKSLIAKHYLGLCDKDGSLLDLETKATPKEPSNTSALAMDDEDLVEMGDKNWTESDYFFQQLKKHHNDVMVLREKLKNECSIELNTLLDVKLQAHLAVNSQCSEAVKKDLLNLVRIWETREVLSECVKYSYGLSSNDLFSYRNKYKKDHVYSDLDLKFYLISPGFTKTFFSKSPVHELKIPDNAIDELRTNIFKYFHDFIESEAASLMTPESLAAYKKLNEWAKPATRDDDSNSNDDSDSQKTDTVVWWIQNMSEKQIQLSFGFEKHVIKDLKHKIFFKEILRLIRTIRGEDYDL